MELGYSGTASGPLALFCARLKRLQLASGITQARLKDVAHLGRAQMSDMLNGRIKRPPDWNVTIAVVRACLEYAETRGRPVPPDLRDEGDWRRRYADLEHDLDAGGRSGPRHEVLPGRRARTSGWHRPPGAVRVRDVRARELGVHAAIQERDSPGELPAYVPRDFDVGLRAAVAAGGEHGCFLLLLGSSSVGKTRSAYEAVLACLPDWWLLHPEDADEVRAVAAAPAPHVVVWLDEFQRYLGEQGLTAGTVRTLRRNGAVLIGTLWPGEYLPRLARTDGSAASPDKELLDLAEVIDVADSLTPQERQSARRLASGDSRIRAALTAGGTGVIQVLAAGPALVRWWEHAPDPYAKAVITAAADARRLGVQSPLSRRFLDAAAGGYLTAAQRAVAPPGWLDAALDYALTPLHGAAAALAPVAVGHRVLGQVDGYLVADYLLQHARRVRRACCPPAVCWQALADHVRDRDDIRRAADSAAARMRYRYAEVLLRRLADDAGAASALASLLSRQGRVDEAIAVLRPLKTDGAPFSVSQLADLLLNRNRIDEAITVLWPSENDAGHWYHTDRLIKLLIAQGRAGEAEALLQARCDSGDFGAPSRLAGLLAGQGRIDDAAAVLRRHTVAGLPPWELVVLLAKAGRVEEAMDVCRTRADAGDKYSCRVLADLLAWQGRAEELWQRTWSGDEFAPWQLADLLADQDNAEELAALLETCHNDPGLSMLVSERLIAVLTDLGRTEDLRRLAESGYFSAGYGLADTLIEQGRIDELRARADRRDLRGSGVS